jgi:hypothetical protein
MMKRTAGKVLVVIVMTALVAGLLGCGGPVMPKEKIMLWNGKDFTGWKLYLPPDAGVDVKDVWSVKDGVVHCKGKPNGYMRTEKEYADYHLHLEWRWVEKPTNSGVLLHAQGPDKVWPQCIEAQLKAQSAGDFVLIGGSGITVDGQDKQDVTKRFVSIPKKKPSNEKPAGQWNSYDIHCCKGGCIKIFVNGELQNEGVKATLKSGWICLQSEGSPIEFRSIYIQPRQQ